MNIVIFTHNLGNSPMDNERTHGRQRFSLSLAIVAGGRFTRNVSKQRSDASLYSDLFIYLFI